MHVSVKTVEFHRGRLMTKLGARSVAELTRFAMQEGLIDSSAGGRVNALLPNPAELF